MHRANDIVGQILLVVLFVIMCATPLAILVLMVLNFIRANRRRTTIVLQALAAIVIWIFLTYGLVLLFMVIIFSMDYPLSTADEWKGNGVVFLGGVIYAAVGAALIYWTRVQARLSKVPGQ